MRIVPVPDGVAGDRKTLGPPAGMSSQDCETIEVLVDHVELPSGERYSVVSALVFVSAEELEAIAKAGGHFWFRAIGTTFPPVMFEAPGT